MSYRGVSLRRGITYIELLIVILIIAALIAVFAPVIYRVHQLKARAACQNNLKQIGFAIHNYAGHCKGKLPPLLDYRPECPEPPRISQVQGWSPFFYSLYPYLEELPLYARSAESKAGWNNDVHTTVVAVLLCPADPSGNGGLCTNGAVGWAGASYAPSYQMFGEEIPAALPHGDKIRCSKYKIGNVPDGTSNTIAVVERFNSFPAYDWSNAAVYPQGGPWGWNSGGAVFGVWGPHLPQIMPPLTRTESSIEGADPYHPNTGHRQCLVLMMDGDVRSVGADVAHDTWKWALQPDDGNIVPGEDWN